MNPAISDSTPANQSPSFHSLVSHQYFHIIFIALIAITLIFTKLGGNGLANYDDCCYAQKAKEILQTGNWMTMHYNHQPAFENPPFYMWLAATSYKVFGVSEYAAKFPSAFMGVATILLIYFFARILFEPWVCFVSSLVLSTTFIFIRYARHAMLDVTLSFFVCLALFALVLALKKNDKYFLLWGLSIAICILTKSVLGFSPLVISVAYMLLTKRWRTLFTVYFMFGCLLIVLVGFSWYVHQYLKFGNEFLRVHFGWLIFQRGFQAGPEPWYEHLSYAEDLLKYYWPWLPVLIIGVVKFIKMSFQKNEHAALLLLWVAIIFGTMSMMTTRVLWYIMPIFPACAMIVGNVLRGFLNEQGRLIFQKISIGIGILAFIILVATPVQVEAEREKDARIVAPYVKHFAKNGAKITAFKYDYYGLNNALLFYSDYAASPIFHTFDEVSKAFEDSSLMLCIVSSSEFDSIAATVRGIHIIRKTEELALISNKELESSQIEPW